MGSQGPHKAAGLGRLSAIKERRSARFCFTLLFCGCVWEDGGVFGKRYGLVRSSAGSQAFVVQASVTRAGC